jgi:hypothetical protein
MFQQLFGQKAGTTNTNIGQSINVGWNCSSKQFPHQGIGKVIAILPH